MKVYVSMFEVNFPIPEINFQPPKRLAMCVLVFDSLVLGVNVLWYI